VASADQVPAPQDRPPGLTLRPESQPWVAHFSWRTRPISGLLGTVSTLPRTRRSSIRYGTGFVVPRRNMPLASLGHRLASGSGTWSISVFQVSGLAVQERILLALRYIDRPGVLASSARVGDLHYIIVDSDRLADELHAQRVVTVFDRLAVRTYSSREAGDHPVIPPSIAARQLTHADAGNHAKEDVKAAFS